MGRRCVTKEECIKMDKPIDSHSRNEVDHPYMIFNNTCTLNCPNDYMKDYENHVCKPCQGTTSRIPLIFTAVYKNSLTFRKM